MLLYPKIPLHQQFIMGNARRIPLLIPDLALVHALTIQETAVVKS